MRNQKREWPTNKEGGGVHAATAGAAAAAKSCLNKIGDGRWPRRRWPTRSLTHAMRRRDNIIAILRLQVDES